MPAKRKPKDEIKKLAQEWERYYENNKAQLSKEAAEFYRRMDEEKRERKRSYAQDPLEHVQKTLGCAAAVKNIDALIGGKIVDIGFHPMTQEGGMAIDYVKNGKTMRTIFGYTELGLWIDWQGETDLKRKNKQSGA